MEIQEYDFLVNEDNELMLIFDGFDDEPENPVLTMEESYLLLTRSPQAPVLRMDGVPADIWEKLELSSSILVCEIDEDGAPGQVYDAAVKKTLNS